nr:hypothetical protein [Myxococcota bacterium]
LPTAIADATRPLGESAVAPGERAQIGGVAVEYLTRAWIGPSMEHGHRGPALSTTIDRGEVAEGMPFGDQLDLGPDVERRFFVGPYRIHARASGEDPPQHVTVRVERRAHCPDHAIIAASDEPRSMWLSTEAIRLHTLDLHGEMVQVSIDATAAVPRVEARSIGWSHSLEPRPGVVRSLRIGRRVVTIDQVVLGRGTRLEGSTWRTDDGSPARVHVRVRIEGAASEPLVAPSAELVSPCGAASAVATTLPPELGATPRERGRTTIAAGQHRELGGAPLDATLHENPGRGQRDEVERWLTIASAAMAPSSVVYGPHHGEGVARTERAVLLFDPEDDEAPPRAVRVRAFPLACARTLTLSGVDAPTYVWLSTIGRTRVTIGAPDRPELAIDLHASRSEVSLAATSEHAYSSTAVAPGRAGHVADFDAHRITVVTVEPGPGTTHADHRWTATEPPLPIVHVQLRIERPSRSP